MKITRKQGKALLRIIIAASIFVIAFLWPSKAGSGATTVGGTVKILLFAAAFVIVGCKPVVASLKSIVRGQIFNENLLMTIASVGAFCIGDYAEGVVVMLFYGIGQWFEGYAVDRSRKSIAGLMDIRPEYANVVRGGAESAVSPDEVMVGETIVIKAGERVPLDGVVIEGGSSLDTSSLTGESIPRDVVQGDEIISGCINLTGLIYVRVTKEYGESTVEKILELVENSFEKKAHTENFITKFAQYYTPIVVLCAAVLAIVPPVVLGGSGWTEWLHRALTFLVISCPCALVISVPLGFFSGIGAASACGILIKGSNYVEVLSKVNTVVFDKTGTLTKGSFEVTGVSAYGIGEEELVEFAAHAEMLSNHPIARAIRQRYGKDVDMSHISEAEERPGYGVRALFDGSIEVCVGNRRMMEAIGAEVVQSDIRYGTEVHIAVDGKYAGSIVIEDSIKTDAKTALESLKKLGVQRVAMLTGDSHVIGNKIAEELGITDAYTELLPSEKVEKLELLLHDESRRGGYLAYVGDGVNDAPVLAQADIGIAMGGLGSDAAIEAADVVIMTDEPSKIAKAVTISRRTMLIVKENIVFALAVKAVVLLLGACGLAGMWAAVFADVGVSVLAILNSLRTMREIRKTSA